MVHMQVRMQTQHVQVFDSFEIFQCMTVFICLICLAFVIIAQSTKLSVCKQLLSHPCPSWCNNFPEIAMFLNNMRKCSTLDVPTERRGSQSVTSYCFYSHWKRQVLDLVSCCVSTEKRLQRSMEDRVHMWIKQSNSAQIKLKLSVWWHKMPAPFCSNSRKDSRSPKDWQIELGSWACTLEYAGIFTP